MNNLDRFKAIVHGERPDYVPIFGFFGAPGVSHGCMKKTHDRLVATGMPAHVGGVGNLSEGTRDVESWHRYWGTTGPIGCDIATAWGAKGCKETRRIEGEFEIIESECGAVTRQVIDNDITYSMPEFITYPVRDRESWEFYRERATPTRIMPLDEMRGRAKAYEGRAQPLLIGAGGAYSVVRGLMGPEKASLTFYDDPELVHDMIGWHLEQVRAHVFPLMEAVQPEIMQMGEDLCYNHGMLFSPEHFDAFCGEYYREVCDAARACGADLVAVDTDGNAMEFVGVASSYGVNGMFPFEVKAGNDLFALRKEYAEFVLFGWLEKEVMNEGNEGLIEDEITSKAPALMRQGRYFPNADHGIQPLATFAGLRKFLTVLHEVTGNPEGEFERCQGPRRSGSRVYQAR